MSEHSRTRHWRWRAVWASVIVVGLVLEVLQSPLYEFGTEYDDELFVKKGDYRFDETDIFVGVADKNLYGH